MIFNIYNNQIILAFFSDVTVKCILFLIYRCYGMQILCGANIVGITKNRSNLQLYVNNIGLCGMYNLVSDN